MLRLKLDCSIDVAIQSPPADLPEGDVSCFDRKEGNPLPEIGCFSEHLDRLFVPTGDGVRWVCDILLGFRNKRAILTNGG